ncbi:helix-turn-helix domain-containing protein [Candidatus Uhrbacteria bacterium]|nr:helix-turn-helix domain-containing protein [Candidatus Uhrbacteria bacterium]
MIQFNKTSVRIPASVGDKLRNAREACGITVEDVSTVLLIPSMQLERIENDDFSRAPETVYHEHSMKAYATYLGLDWDSLRLQYRRERQVFSPSPSQQNRMSGSPLHRSSFWVMPHIIRTGIFSTIAVASFAYLAFLGYQMVRPPHLQLVSPGNNALSVVDTIEVAGYTERDARILINGEQITKGIDGEFRQVIGLREGVNVIQVTATKKFGGASTESRTVIYSEEPFTPGDGLRKTGLNFNSSMYAKD